MLHTYTLCKCFRGNGCICSNNVESKYIMCKRETECPHKCMEFLQD